MNIEGEQITFALLFHPRRRLQLTHIDAQLTIYQYHTPPPKQHRARQSTYTIPKITYLAQEQHTIRVISTLSPPAREPHPAHIFAHSRPTCLPATKNTTKKAASNQACRGT